MQSKLDDAMAALAAERDRTEAKLGQLNAAIDALRDVMQTSAAPARRRPGRPRKNAAAPARKVGRPRKAAGPKARKARAAKKPVSPPVWETVDANFAADPARESTALEISTALGADDRGVRLSLGRMAKKNRATKLEGGRYRAYSA